MYWEEGSSNLTIVHLEEVYNKIMEKIVKVELPFNESEFDGLEFFGETGLFCLIQKYQFFTNRSKFCIYYYHYENIQHERQALHLK